MADKNLMQAEEVLDETAESVEVTEEYLEVLRAEIADLEEKEKTLTEKLCAAKEKGLVQQADRCRALLQKVVMQKRVKKDELQEAEAQKLAKELDALAEELELEFEPELFEEEKAQRNEYRSKSKRLSLISRMIGFIGVFACMVGSLVYLILTQSETMNLPFEWISLAITGVAAVIFVIIALLIGGSANSYKKLADETDAEIAEAERLLAEQKAIEMLSLAKLNAVSEAYAIEDAGVQQPPKKLFGKVKVPEVPETVKNNVHKIMPIAAVCTAVVAAMAISSSQKKSAAAKKAAAARREFFNWLG